MNPSQIGVAMRDTHGIPRVKSITGAKILRLLKMVGLSPTVPEDLYSLVKKAVSMRKHLNQNN